MFRKVIKHIETARLLTFLALKKSCWNSFRKWEQ